MRLFSILAILLSLIACSGLKDPKPLVGAFTWEKWSEESKWLIEPYHQQSSNNEKIKELKNLTDEKKIRYIIFATSYCDECKMTIPKVFGIFTAAGITENQYKLYGLDYNLNEPTGEYRKYKFKSTPAMFIEQNNLQIAEIDLLSDDWLQDIIETLKK